MARCSTRWMIWRQSTNAALAENGLPTHTVDEVRMFVGNGIGKLIERAVPDGQDNPKFQAVYDAFVAHYGAHSRDHTKPYDGILPMLDALAAKGVKLAIVSNKIDFAVKALSRDYFGNRMQAAIGDDPSRRRKPAPDSVLEAMRQMGVTREKPCTSAIRMWMWKRRATRVWPAAR